MQIDISSPVYVIDALTDVLRGEITCHPWDCDIRSISAENINLRSLYAKRKGKPLEPGFMLGIKRWMTLAELISHDLEQLFPLHPILERMPNLVILEAFSQDPNAQVLAPVTIGSATHTILVFHTPLIWYLNSFFQKFHILTALDIYAGCLDIHRSEMETQKYDDLHILLAIYDDLEVLCDKEFLNDDPHPKFLGPPYDLCEQVDGARQFIVSHEIGHALLQEIPDDEGVGVFRDLLRRTMNPALEQHQLDHWAAELWCDEFSIRTLNQWFLRTPDSEQRQNFIGNAIRGILLFLFMLYVIEVSRGETQDEIGQAYPPAELRYWMACETVKRLSLFQDSFTQKGIKAFHKTLGTVRSSLAGLTFSVQYGPMHMALENHLSKFSRALYNNLFYRIVRETRDIDASPWSAHPF